MSDQRMQPLLEAWFQDREVTPDDVRQSTSRVMARLPEVRQRGRWWPLPTFERPVSAFPSREPDPALTPATDGPAPARGFTMYSALKFVAASVIVALFGGFLLAGILGTQQDRETLPAALTGSPSPMTTQDMLSGMVTEEVEPGVFRVVDDGHRDLGSGVSHFRQHAVITDAAGGVWRVMPEGRFFRIGEAAEWRFDPGLVEIDQSNTEATPDGRLVTAGAVGIRFFRDGTWDPGEYGYDFGQLGDIEVGDDGTVWLLDPSEPNLFWYGPEQPWSFSSWQDEARYDGLVRGDELVVVGADVWLTGHRDSAEDTIDAFLRFDGDDWQVVPAPDGLARNPVGGDGSNFGVTPDGSLWTAGDASDPHRHLARFDGSGWTTFGEADGVRPWGGNQGLWPAFEIPVDMLRVAPDGGVWVNAAVVDATGDAMCDGLGRYDGQTWSPWLSGSCILDYDFAPDGSVWVVAEDGPRPSWTDEASGAVVHTYVITPEAVAAST